MPPLSIAPTPTAKGEIHTLTAKPQRGMIVQHAADCIVMRVAHAPVELLIAAYARQSLAVVPAMKVDRIALGDASASAVAPVAPAAATQNKLVIKERHLGGTPKSISNGPAAIHAKSTI